MDAAVLANAAQPGQSVLEDGRARSRGNVAAAGVRREPGGDAACRGRAGGGSRRPDAHDSAGAAAGPAAPGQDLPLPGLQCPDRRGASRAALGPRGPDQTIEPRVALPSASSRGARGGLSARATTRRRAPVPTAGWPRVARCPRAAGGARRSGGSDPGAERRAGAHAPCAHAGSPSGSESGWTCAGRSTCCIRAPRIAKPRRRAHVHAHNGESARAPRARYGTRSSFRNSSSSCLGTSARSRTLA